jgi:diacylglycerol kinase (ATP)
VAREIALLTNPTSGKGRGSATAAAVLPRLTDAGLDVRSIQGRDAAEALELARAAVADGVDSLVVVGGDGLVHLAAQALAGSTTSLGIIPCGTGNDVARTLEIPRRDVRAAADVVIGSRTRRIDLARCGSTYFVTVLAAGFDSLVTERANRMRRPRPYTLELDGVARDVEAMLVAVGNGPSFGGGLRITHGASVEDGLLDVVIIKTMSKPGLVRTYPQLFTGAHTSHPAYEHHRVRSATVSAPGITAYADGERVGPLPLTVDVEPLALEVLVP